MSHGDIGSYYSTVFSLVQVHSWSLSDIESLYPFERDIYVSLILESLKGKS